MNPPYYARRPGTGDHDPRWALVGGCPAPGAPVSLGELATALAGWAATAQDDLYVRVDGLGHGVGDTGWSGGAADAFAARFAQIPPRLLVMSEALEASSRTLQDWAELLEALKHRAWGALADAESAHSRQEAAQAAIDAAGDDDDISGHVAARDRAAADLAAARRQCATLREAHEDGTRGAAAVIAGVTPAVPFYADDLHESLLLAIGGPDILVALAAGDAPSAHAMLGPSPAGWITLAENLTGALRHVTGASTAAALRALGPADGAATPANPLDELSRHPRQPLRPPVPAATPAATDLEIPTIPVLPVYRDVVPAALPTLLLTDIPIPRPLRYFDWFEAAEHAPTAGPSWLDSLGGADALGAPDGDASRPVHAAPDLDGFLNDYAQGGGLTVAAPLDPAPVRG